MKPELNYRPETVAATKESIEHWLRMREYTREQRDGGKAAGFEEPFSDDCSLCKRFNGPDDCEIEHSVGVFEKCPIYAKTKLPGCNGSPYSEAQSAWWLRYGSESNQSWREAATRMIEFLIKLLPDHEQQNFWHRL